MNIFFIRHGETTGDIEHRYGGDYDDHLTEKGIEQSKRVAEKLKDQGIAIVICSPLQRAKETAKLIADAAGCSPVVRPDLRERNRYGILTGALKAEARKTHPDLVAALADRFNTIEGAEAYEDFCRRVHQAFDGVISTMAHSKVTTAGVVWHGGPMRILLSDILKFGEAKEIGDCAFVELRKDGNAWQLKNVDGITF